MATPISKENRVGISNKELSRIERIIENLLKTHINRFRREKNNVGNFGSLRKHFYYVDQTKLIIITYLY